MLMHEGATEVAIGNGSNPRNESSLEGFRKGVKDYYILGLCSYRDAFERLSRVDACWEVRADQEGSLKRRPCKSADEINKDLQKKDEAEKDEGWQ